MLVPTNSAPVLTASVSTSVCKNCQDSARRTGYRSYVTVYLQIQNAIDFVEHHLADISCERAATAANMSVRCFYNYFEALTGYTYGGYVRKRRLSEAARRLHESEARVIVVALECGYESPESFSRAFRAEFGISPVQSRQWRQALRLTDRITIVEEQGMEVIVRDLMRMRVVSYVGYSPTPEDKAHDRIWAWAKRSGYIDRPHRNFGHDTDANGEGYGNVGNRDNYGYKVMVTVDDGLSTTDIDEDLRVEIIEPGRFVVTGVEGDVRNDWTFIPQGWSRLRSEAERRGYALKTDGRCMEEKLEPSVPGHLRLDLYMEIE